MMFDRMFYDPVRSRYTVDSFLDEGVGRFGGYDAVVLWHAYPRIGFDDRNQFDFYRDMPGGLDGLRELSRDIHERGVKVFIDYNPWDTGTRREGKSDIETLAELVKAIDADGIFLDTLHEGTEDFRRKLDAARPGVVLESELTLPIERIRDHHMSWAQWFKDTEAPGVLRNKWLERRHMMHQIKRWNLDHAGELHTAWMNGSGILIWENVFGSWVGWSARDRSILRAILPVQRRYVSLFSGEDWTPLVETEQQDIYASLWQSDGLCLWTLVNRSDKTVEGVLLTVPYTRGMRYFDLLGPGEVRDIANGIVSMTGSIPPRGIGAFLGGPARAVEKDFAEFLAERATGDTRFDSDVASLVLTERLRPVSRTKKFKKAEIPDGMIAIPAATFDMETKFRNRECGFRQVPGLGQPTHPSQRLHRIVGVQQHVQFSPYAIDLTPVTNADYVRFLKATRYKPRHGKNFLKHWVNGKPPMGLEDHPVVYVDLDDARAYARWAGKRLPAEEEWQYAAQGRDGRAYPWGSKWQEGRCNAGHTGGTTSVTTFGEGRSPFGCYDMCGNVWEWTESERTDGRTRFCIIRGGSYYKAEGSAWYTDGGPQPCNFAAKFILMWPGLDRCATIGFRCVVDVADGYGKPAQIDK
jgi:formylglycine-generating enzyme required for sulfatase activity